MVEMAELFSKTIRDIAQNANPKIVFFDLALQVTLLLLQK